MRVLHVLLNPCFVCGLTGLMSASALGSSSGLLLADGYLGPPASAPGASTAVTGFPLDPAGGGQMLQQGRQAGEAAYAAAHLAQDQHPAAMSEGAGPAGSSGLGGFMIGRAGEHVRGS